VALAQKPCHPRQYANFKAIMVRPVVYCCYSGQYAADPIQSHLAARLFRRCVDSDCLRSAPSSCTLRIRNGRSVVHFAGSRHHGHADLPRSRRNPQEHSVGLVARLFRTFCGWSACCSGSVFCECRFRTSNGALCGRTSVLLGGCVLLCVWLRKRKSCCLSSGDVVVDRSNSECRHRSDHEISTRRFD